jgi:hypothetical protein
MHRVGIAGYQNFDAALQTPQVVKNRLSYMTPEWKDAFKYAVSFGADLGMEEAIAGSPGWSESGGPWVPPAEGMKKYVWSETAVEGGKPFKAMLAEPPQNTGAFQNIGIRDIDLGTPRFIPCRSFTPTRWLLPSGNRPQTFRLNRWHRKLLGVVERWTLHF